MLEWLHRMTFAFHNYNINVLDFLLCLFFFARPFKFLVDYDETHR